VVIFDDITAETLLAANQTRIFTPKAVTIQSSRNYQESKSRSGSYGGKIVLRPRGAPGRTVGNIIKKLSEIDDRGGKASLTLNKRIPFTISP